MRTTRNADVVADKDVRTGAVADANPIEDRGALATVPPLALRAADAAKCLGICARQLWSLTRAGQIPHVRIGRSIVYPVAALNLWLCRRAKGGK